MIPENIFQTEKEYTGEDDNSFKPRLKGHKMVVIPSGLLVFGGKTSDGRYSNTLWHYNFSSLAWSVKAEESPVRPTPVWLHCLVIINLLMLLNQGHQHLLPINVPLEFLGVHLVDLLLELSDDRGGVPAVVQGHVGQVGVRVVYRELRFRKGRV